MSLITPFKFFIHFLSLSILLLILTVHTNQSFLYIQFIKVAPHYLLLSLVYLLHKPLGLNWYMFFHILTSFRILKSFIVIILFIIHFQSSWVAGCFVAFLHSTLSSVWSQQCQVILCTHSPCFPQPGLFPSTSNHPLIITQSHQSKVFLNTPSPCFPVYQLVSFLPLQIFPFSHPILSVPSLPVYTFSTFLTVFQLVSFLLPLISLKLPEMCPSMLSLHTWCIQPFFTFSHLFFVLISSPSHRPLVLRWYFIPLLSNL